MSTSTTHSSTRADAPRLYGFLAEYGTSGEVLHAAEKIRDAGYTRWDCLTPFPVHGLDAAMGIKKTILPFLVLGAGLTGMTIGILLQWYVNTPHLQSASSYIVSSYPLIISGKPYWSLPAHIPVIFELTVLLSAVTCFLGVWGLCGLPKFYHPLFNSARFRRVTDDKFFLAIETEDVKFNHQQTLALLQSTHPTAIEEVKD